MYKKIIVVDDDRLYLTLIKNLMEKNFQSETVCFANPLEALTWCERHEADLILADYLMPELDGLEWIRRFRAMPGKEHTPVIMITSAEDVKVRQEALQIGANDFLRKPIDKSELTARTRNMLSIGQLNKTAGMVRLDQPIGI